MVLNKFFINVFIRVTFIVLSSVALGIAFQQLDHGYYYTLAGIIFSDIVVKTWLLVTQVDNIKQMRIWKNSFHRFRIMTHPFGFLKMQ